MSRIIYGLVILAAALLAGPDTAAQQAQVEPVEVGVFDQQLPRFYSTADGLQSNDIRDLLILEGSIYAATGKGVARLAPGEDTWTVVEGFGDAPVELLTNDGPLLGAFTEGTLLFSTNRAPKERALLPPSLRGTGRLKAAQTFSLLATDQGFFARAGDTFEHFSEPDAYLGEGNAIWAFARSGSNFAVATAAGLFYGPSGLGGEWKRLFPEDGARDWAMRDTQCVEFDAQGRLWAAAPSGVAVLGDDWTLFDGSDGVPYLDFTAMDIAPNGDVWFGTTLGAIHCRVSGLPEDITADDWSYRQGLRWLPSDDVRDVAVDAENAAWFATANGIGVIEPVPMTLREKALKFEEEMDTYHPRTEHGFMNEVSLDKPGDKSVVHKHDSDNDGLWTSMYGAGECFAYAATKGEAHKQRAKRVFEALKFLGDVTQGGEHSPPDGFVARTVLPASGENPNAERYTPEKDRQKQQGDKYWKVITPRWPKSADGKWYWKCDTSSDEIDGHYFFYGLYYDLVADTEEEKARVREHVCALTDHLIEHDFNLVDHDGKPTRWAVYDPAVINHDPNWFVERGLNSLSMLSYLAVAEHMTGGQKYRDAAGLLIEKHSYAVNLLEPKVWVGPGSGNQSDDEMAFMSYYNLVRYEKDPRLRSIYAFSLHRYWRMEEPENNPLFNYIYAACCLGESFTSQFGTWKLEPTSREWIVESAQWLKDFPLDRVNWRHINEHRADIVKLPETAFMWDLSGVGSKGYRVNGDVLPPDERHFNHFNHDPWRLNTGGSGTGFSTSTVYTLPYYMGLYHGYIEETATEAPGRRDAPVVEGAEG